ncbi:hypothetical protein IQ241_12725 [Romeria aff. gracilis LEGE 07310]|uniref:Uncharacterized protein n=1 Tax=Vasconcelosia minhoensis LEGE 07310 TaxID=915328 RepID=A0A8J7APG2_9CYAN|nr:hypothetical protein [Romeria gracilis]MBE9078144.1 hypothetical protein [Romeria aff. gracilis LEGE 07310]
MLGAANEQLKGGNIPVRIVTPGESERLYLRGTFPPKPGSGKSQSYQKRISLGIYFNPAGIKRAEAEAQRLNHLLMLGQFDWSDWLTVKQRGQMVGQWLKEFERDYFIRRERNPKSETTWEKDYAIPKTGLYCLQCLGRFR